jgi:high mobility group protein B1
MSDNEKKRFQEMADVDKKRYELEMQSYVPPKGEKVGRGKKRRHTKDPLAPKRSLSAFFWFCNDERAAIKAKNPEYGVGEIAKELGRMWSGVDPEGRRKYEAMAERDKARYDKVRCGVVKL